MGLEEAMALDLGVEYMRKKVLVTGAGGYLGRHVVKSLLDSGAEVIAADLVEPQVDARATCVVTNIFDGDEDLYSELGDPDVLVHLAWRNGFKHDDESHLEDFPKHYFFLSNMLSSGLDQMVVMGTMHEVGYHEGAITEETPCSPASLYGISKNSLRRATELAAARAGAVFQWIRAFYIVGDDKFSNSIFAKLLSAADEGIREFPFTTGSNLYDFISVQELADQIAAVAMQHEVTGIINACSGEPMSLADRVEKYIVENELDIKLKYGAFPDREYDSPGVWGDPTKIDRIMRRRGIQCADPELPV